MNEIEGMNDFYNLGCPFIHYYMIDYPSHAIILQIRTFNLPKIHKIA